METETDEKRETFYNNCVHASGSFHDYATHFLNELLEFKSNCITRCEIPYYTAESNQILRQNKFLDLVFLPWR